MFNNIIRWFLTMLLLYGVYKETGIWTAVFALLVTLYIELEARFRR